jgi:hypothetical protein
VVHEHEDVRTFVAWIYRVKLPGSPPNVTTKLPVIRNVFPDGDAVFVGRAEHIIVPRRFHFAVAGEVSVFAKLKVRCFARF